MSSVKCDSPISTEENKAVCLPERVECVCESVREDAAGLGGRPRQPKSSEKFADPTTPQAPNHSAPESHTCFSAAPLATFAPRMLWHLYPVQMVENIVKGIINGREMCAKQI